MKVKPDKFEVKVGLTAPQLSSLMESLSGQALSDTYYECMVTNFLLPAMTSIGELFEAAKDRLSHKTVQNGLKDFTEQAGAMIAELCIAQETLGKVPGFDVKSTTSHLRGVAALASPIPFVHGAKQTDVRNLLKAGAEEGSSSFHIIGAAINESDCWTQLEQQWNQCSVAEVEEGEAITDNCSSRRRLRRRRRPSSVVVLLAGMVVNSGNPQGLTILGKSGGRISAQNLAPTLLAMTILCPWPLLGWAPDSEMATVTPTTSRLRGRFIPQSLAVGFAYNSR
jgi:hypothetical protein